MSMLKKIRSKPDAYVIIRMHEPIQRKAAGDVEDDIESDLEDNSLAKKVRILSHLCTCQ
jgi:hypothetical protein